MICQVLAEQLVNWAACAFMDETSPNPTMDYGTMLCAQHEEGKFQQGEQGNDVYSLCSAC